MGLKEIFKQGMQEFKRRSALGKEKRDLKNNEKLHADRLTALGKKAWDANLELDCYEGLKNEITETQTQIDELKKRQTELENQQATVDKKKQTENDRFESRRKEVEDKKKHVDSRLGDENKILKAAQKDQSTAKSRLKQIDKEKDQLAKKSADAATSDQERQEIRTKLAGFDGEVPQLEQQVKSAEETIRRQQQAMAPIEAEADQLQKEIDHIKTEQKNEIGALDKQLAGIKSNLDECTDTLDKTVNQQNGHYKKLGENIAKNGVTDPAITPELSEVQNTEKEMTEIRNKIDKLEQQGTSASRSAFWKMIGVIVAFIAAIILLVMLWNSIFGSKPKTPEEQAREIIESKLPGIIRPPDARKVPDSEVEQKEPDVTPPTVPATQTIEDATAVLKKRSEEIQGGEIVVAEKATLVAALPSIGAWEMDPPKYMKSAMGKMEYAMLSTIYKGPDNKEIDVTVTDAGTASAMLFSYQSIFNGNISYDNEEGYQRIGKYNGIPVIENYDKRTRKNDFSFIIKNRYLVKLRATGENSLSLLKYFMAKFDSSKLQ